MLELLPETAFALEQAISFKSPVPTLIEYFENYEESRGARLNHFSAQLTDDQLAIVDRAITHAREHAAIDDANPNRRGNALFHICQQYLA